jgi:hypothetical protein
MHFKFDENADPRWRVPLEEAGNTVSTVAEEKPRGEAVATMAAVRRSLDMRLLTLDLHFAQSTDYPPDAYSGIVVPRHPKPTLKGMRALARQVVTMLRRESPCGRLRIVEPGRARIRE